MRMKNMISAAIVLAVLTSTSSFAASGSDMAAGFQLGANIAKFTGTSAAGSTSKTGFIIGGQFEYKLADMFYFMPGLRYTMKGATQSATVGTVTIENKYKINYIEIPLYAKVKFMEGETFRPFFLIGPNIGFKASSTVDTTVTISGVTATGTGTVTGVKSTDFALDFGGGGEFDVDAGMSAFLNVVYSLGLANISDATGTDLKNSGIQFVAGMNFAL